MSFEEDQTGQDVECPNCLQTTTLSGGTRPEPPKIPASAQTQIRSSSVEPAIFSDRGVTVTRSRLVVGHTVYSISQINIIEPSTVPADRNISILLLIVGSALLIGSFSISLVCVVPALTFLAFGVVGFIKAKAQYMVSVVTSSGRVQAVTSSDGVFVSNVFNALSEAMAIR